MSGVVGPILTHTEITKFAFAFEGVDPKCAEGRGEGSCSCAIHIHEGTSCDEPPGDLLVGKGVKNPWNGVHYTATEDGRATGLVSIVTGLCTEDVIGHVLGIHDHEGTRIACSLIAPMPEVAHATGLVPYKGYEGSLTKAAGGAYPITSDGTKTKFTFDIIGADPSCKAGRAEGVKLSCGLHLHVGTSCEEEVRFFFYPASLLMHSCYRQAPYRCVPTPLLYRRVTSTTLARTIPGWTWATPPSAATAALKTAWCRTLPPAT